jgi:glycosyltransferase involved in cell wall biosynthesis
MRYPNILFYRHEKYNEVDKILESKKDLLLFNPNIVSSLNDVYKLFDSNYHLLITYGENEKEYYYLDKVLVNRMFIRWLHFSNINDIDEVNRKINHCYINNVIRHRNETRPIFSIFTTTYNSYSKIFRAYDSIKKQEFRDWEWVILDDSPDDTHFIFLKDLFKNEYRVRLYKRECNSGSIGEVKNEAVNLCRGKYVLEMDHDDEIMPDVLSNAVKVFEHDTEIGFVYMDTVNIHENGENYCWGDFISKGYGSYYTMKYNNKWVYVYITPNINNITLSHIVCVPNHPRIWKKEVIQKVGNYSELLPICDDLELLLRTAVNTKMAKVSQFAYLQYMNEGGNNFTWIRNKEICRIGPLITQSFNTMYNVDEEMKKRDAYEDIDYKYNMSKIWKRKNYEHKYCNKIYNFHYDKQFCIIGLDSLDKNIQHIREKYSNKRNDFILLDNNAKIEELWNKIDDLGLDRMKCYNFKDNETKEEMVNYFNLLYKSCEVTEIIDSA